MRRFGDDEVEEKEDDEVEEAEEVLRRARSVRAWHVLGGPSRTPLR